MIMRWYHWIPVALGLVVGFVAFLLGRRLDFSSVDEELGVIEARRQAQEHVIRLGAENAVARVEHDYRETIERLDKEALHAIDRYRSDPVALAVWLERIAWGRVSPT